MVLTTMALWVVYGLIIDGGPSEAYSEGVMRGRKARSGVKDTHHYHGRAMHYALIWEPNSPYKPIARVFRGVD
jgi:hypothetical protein